MTRLKLHVAVLAVLAMTTSVAVPAAAQKAFDGPQWPNVEVDEPRWPNIRPEDLPDPTPNPRPAFLDPDQVANRILRSSPKDIAGSALNDITGSSGPRWPTLQPESQPPSFAFEVGTRYWYSTGQMRFGFANGDPLFGSPTSTLDWEKLTAHSGEIFGRIDHKPTGMFVKGMAGMGGIVGGDIIDRDFLVNQVSFSDTTSSINDGKLRYAMFDVGWAYSPVPDIRIGIFAGYHYWSESATAYGVRCNQVTFPFNLCGAPGDVPVGFDTAVLRYEPTWHAVRLGVEGRAAITDRWSVNAEIAAVPFAVLQNNDSHLLRQDPSDLGSAPNVITSSNYAYGVETELFINYALTPNIEFGGGVRYWGLVAKGGEVKHGPDFASRDFLNNFDQQRYGVLLHVKGKF